MIKLNDEVSIGRVLMAPLAGITDPTFRGILLEMGADLTYTEMVSAKALHYKNETTRHMLRLAPNQREVAVQLFGDDPKILAGIAESFEERPEIVLIDINMGCPAPKIVKNGEGAALMRTPEKAAEIIEEVRRRTTKPVTCKFRRGYGMGDETAVEFARRMEAAGASLLTVHGRFRDQLYEGESDRAIVRKVKQAVRIPVIGNGDIFSGVDALAMFRETGCDGIMVARGALGNPFIFREIQCALQGKTYQPPGTLDRLDVAIRHLKGTVADLGELVGVREMRKHMAWYFKGIHKAAQYKNAMNHAATLEEAMALLEELRAISVLREINPSNEG